MTHPKEKMNTNNHPPSAKKVPHAHDGHVVRDDPYQWLRDDSRESPEVIEYLKEENLYSAEAMQDTESLQDDLFKEFKEHIKETDISAPYKDGDYFYYYRTEEGSEYPIYCRRRAASLDEFQNATEEIFFDQNKEAEGHATFNVGGLKNNNAQTVFAIAIETDGSERYTLRFRDIATGEDYGESIENTTGNIEWSSDDRYVFYTVYTKVTRRSYRVYRHEVGTSVEGDVLVFEELDEGYSVRIDKSDDESCFFISKSTKETDEIYWVPTDDPFKAPKLILKEKEKREYSVERQGDQFLIMTNDDALDFNMVYAPIDNPENDWKEFIPHEETELLEGFLTFKDFIVVKRRVGGFSKLFVYPKDGTEPYEITFEEEVYSVGFGPNAEYDATSVRIVYDSLVTPHTDIEFDMNSRTKTIIKQKEVPGYNPEDFETHLVYAEAEDGKRIPISLVYKKGTVLDGNNPTILSGYGSYGLSSNPHFSSSKLSLLSRGFILATAHIRGGGEMGRGWYNDGKYLNKQNTFTDFIACAEHLIKNGYTSQNSLIARGGSAGGLLVGAVVNMRPELFAGVVAGVPFVDVVTTMSDPTIPLTVGEYREWGDPAYEEYFKYMLSYSPYDNVIAQNYPPMLVTAGINDPRVAYWEPAKWVAKLRATKTDDNLLILKTEMEQGHGGASGRYDYLKQLSYEYAFILKVLGIN